MARQIIILDNSLNSSGDIGLQYACWYPVTVGKEVPVTKPSVWSGASTTENAAILAGRVVEEVAFARVPAGTSVAQIKAYLQNAYNARAAQLGGVPATTKQYYGLSWDGTTWS